MKRDILGYIPAILLPAVLNFVSLIIYTHVFNTVEYGRYVLLIGTAAFAALIVSQWQIQSAQKYRPEYRRQGNIDGFNRYMLLLAAASSVVVLVLACGGLWWLSPGAALTSEEYILTAILIWSQSLYAVPLTVLQSDGKVRLYRFFQVANAVMKFSGGLIGIWAFAPRIESLLYSAIAANALLIFPLLAASGLAASARSGSRCIPEWKSLTSRFARYGLPMTGWTACIGILDICDRYLLQWLGESGEVGVYAAHYSLAAALFGVVSAPFFTAAHPSIMNAECEAEAASRMVVFTRLYLAAAAPVAVGLVSFHREIAGLFLGASFMEGTPIIPVLAVAFLLWNMSIIGHKGYEYKGKSMTMLGFVAIGAALNVGLNLFLIPLFGAMGAAYATLVGFGAYTALVYAFSGRYIQWVIPFRWIVKLAIMLLLTGLSIHWWREWLSNIYSPIGVSIVGGLSALLLYTFILILFGELKVAKVKVALSQWRTSR